MNNPLTKIDPTGFEIKVETETDKDGRRHTKITVTGVLINKSSQKLSEKQLEGIKTKITDAIQKAWKGEDKKTNQDWSTSVDLKVATDPKQITDKQNIFEIHNKSDMPPAEGIKEGTGETAGKAEHYSRFMMLSESLLDSSQLKRTSAHEFGHMMGLNHPDEEQFQPKKDGALYKSYDDNIMFQSQRERAGWRTNKSQIENVIFSSEHSMLNPWLKTDRSATDVKSTQLSVATQNRPVRATSKPATLRGCSSGDGSRCEGHEPPRCEPPTIHSYSPCSRVVRSPDRP